jgi:methanogenic corrinoid protein MtbC1
LIHVETFRRVLESFPSDMILWCSYCLKYLGERAPFTDFSISHVICPECLAKVRGKSGEQDIESVRRINSRLQLMDFSSSAELGDLIEEGHAMGMTPQDLMIGLLQPVLHNVGEKWSRAELTVAEEHQVTAMVTTIVDQLFRRFSNDNMRQASEPDVLLLCALGNYHILGLRMLEFLLVTAQVPCFTIYPGIPNREAKTLITSLKPAFVGISIALKEQLDSVNELAEMLQTESRTSSTTIVVGGTPLRDGSVTSVAPNVIACNSANDFLELVQKDRRRHRLSN